jgi:FemAB-related protein (PEP-CTERM system-associated)
MSAVSDIATASPSSGATQSRLIVQSLEGNSGSAEWDEFVSRAADAELYHQWGWRAIIERTFGHETHYLVARGDGGETRGVLPLVRLKSRLFGDFLVSLPYFNYAGVLAESPAASQALLEEAERLAHKLGVSHIELRHRGAVELALPMRDDKVAMLLNVPNGEDGLWSSFKPKLRAQIRRPEKEGATVREGGAELVDDFYAVFARNMRDLGTPVYARQFFQAIVASFPAQARIFVVDLARTPVAAGLVLAHRKTLEIPWASSLREANPAGVNMLLYWSVLRYAAARGFRRFDFGRSSKDSGTYRFKLQWGAQPEPLKWHYWLRGGGAVPQLTPHNPKYRLAVAAWRKLPVSVANLLGPHIVKNLP